jgi:hypothetical protein
MPMLEIELATKMTSKAELPNKPQRDCEGPEAPRLELSVTLGSIPEH